MYHPSITHLMALFDGYHGAYGTYQLTGEREGVKVKGKAASLKGEVSMELWHLHISGRQGLGIIPINERSEVKFAAIDVDVYPFSVAKLNQTLKEHKIPLIPCRTKSGGVHLYLFLTRFHDAKPIIKKMREIASFLGFGECEIYPRQTKIVAERGDIGQWINMPYFTAVKTERYAWTYENVPMSLDDFVTRAQGLSQDPVQFTKFRLDEGELEGGPPCLKHLIRGGFPSGTRNNGLFNLAVYAKKRDPDNWRQLIEQYNAKYMDPPLTAGEVLGVIQSINKKEFNYMCEQHPIRNYCDRDRCRTCEFGIGKVSAGFPKFGTLTKINTVPPIWFLEVEEGGRLELTTQDLQSPIHFQARCMDVLNIMPELPKRSDWMLVVKKLFDDLMVVDIPEETTPKGQLMQHLEDFLLSRVQGKSRDEIILGKPYTEDGFHYFRFRDFIDYLERMRWKLLDQSAILAHLKDLGAGKRFFNIKGRGTNVYSLPELTDKSVLKPLDPVKPEGPAF